MSHHTTLMIKSFITKGTSVRLHIKMFGIYMVSKMVVVCEALAAHVAPFLQPVCRITCRDKQVSYTFFAINVISEIVFFFLALSCVAYYTVLHEFIFKNLEVVHAVTMYLFYVSSQTSSIAKRFFTNGTKMQILFFMHNCNMFLQMERVAKYFPTQITLISLYRSRIYTFLGEA